MTALGVLVTEQNVRDCVQCPGYRKTWTCQRSVCWLQSIKDTTLLGAWVTVHYGHNSTWFGEKATTRMMRSVSTHTRGRRKVVASTCNVFSWYPQNRKETRCTYPSGRRNTVPTPSEGDTFYPHQRKESHCTHTTGRRHTVPTPEKGDTLYPHLRKETHCTHTRGS